MIICIQIESVSSDYTPDVHCFTNTVSASLVCSAEYMGINFIISVKNSYGVNLCMSQQP